MKNRRKAVQPFEIKKRKIDISRNYEANVFEKNQRKFENFSTLISKKSTSEPPHIRFLFVEHAFCYRLPPDPVLPLRPCRVANSSPHRRAWDLHPKEVRHAGRTKKKLYFSIGFEEIFSYLASKCIYPPTFRFLS